MRGVRFRSHPSETTTSFQLKLIGRVRSSNGHGALAHLLGAVAERLMRPTYNRVKRVRARSEGPNPSGPAIHAIITFVKVEKQKFDSLLSKVLRTKPEPRAKIKARRNGPKTPILQKP